MIIQVLGYYYVKNKDSFEVEFALKDFNKPIGVSEFSFNELPIDVQNAMPTVEEFEYELFKDEQFPKHLNQNRITEQ